ncbi:MAG: hypothetical protein KDE20_13725 [Caldilineaceae bacterium]|nr:hypothetical protein [Caldilineaceae bacterium]
MSHYDYIKSQEIGARDFPFYALIMAAIRQADANNLQKLRAMWPNVVDEFAARYTAPGGVLESDPDQLKRNVWGFVPERS